ncbi:heterokaryon incompatibility protein-domain-containing protein [Cercophora newfieldiana]|uniref:Heterokaryon incompatibility protein-domain-containing protein n=1 Tax=Cercophora newfieldiana TaxID=92897 RepID=A0AA39YB21_9PEZI|nr:heterokaryon incompatibility protein-domain-containing protein [Cercophora newfieldiana]
MATRTPTSLRVGRPDQSPANLHRRASLSGGPNLFAALTRIRNFLAGSADTTTPIWVDAICINQSDLPEREAQVRLMGRVYAQADEVIAELGDPAPALGELREFIDFARQVEWCRTGRVPSEQKEIKLRLSGRDENDDEYGPAQERITVPELQREMQSLSGASVLAGYLLISCANFSRVWIRQEFLLARHLRVLFGGYPVTLDELTLVINAILDLDLNDTMGDRMSEAQADALTDDRLNQNLPGLMTLLVWYDRRKSNEHREGSHGLLAKLMEARTCLATDPRDKIYAVISLAADGKDYLPSVNYVDDMQTVCKTYARLFVQNGQAAQLLYAIGSYQDINGTPTSSAAAASTTWPSWVPNWSKRLSDLPITNIWDNNRPFSAAGSLPTSARVVPSPSTTRPHVLVIKGSTLDTIVSLTPSFHDPADGSIHAAITDFVKTSITLLAPDQDNSKEPPLYAPTGETLLEAIFRTIIKGPPYPLPAKEIASLRQGFLTYVRSSSEESDDDSSADRDAFRNAAEDIDGRPLCVTRNGYFGLAPRDARLGDEVAVLYGGFVPFVLRPTPRPGGGGGGESVYTVVGNGYFHGLMHGEALRLPSFGERDIELV